MSRSEVRTLAWLFMLLSAIALTACASSPASSDDDLADLPSLKDVRPRVAPVHGPSATRSQSAPRAELMMQRFDLPLNTPLREVWEIADETALSNVAQRVWNANGLRVGTISRTQLKALFEHMPVPMAVQRQRIIGSSFPTALRETAWLHKPVTVEMSYRADESKQKKLRGGRLRLLASMEPTSFGSVRTRPCATPLFAESLDHPARSTGKGTRWARV